ncbi:MAG: cytochrome P450 [Actinomycetota bacterium]
MSQSDIDDRQSAAEDVVRQLFLTSEGRIDPYPHYHRLRALSPVHHSTTLNAWLLTRYADCRAALRDPRLEKHFADTLDVRAPGWRDRESLNWAANVMLNLDGPAHTRLRRLVVREFTTRTVQALRPRVEQTVDELLDNMLEHDAGELMEEFAFKLPISLIGALLGVPAQDRPQFRELTRALTGVFEVTADAAMLDAADAATRRFTEYFDQLIEIKRANPSDDLLSRLVLQDAVQDVEDGEADRLTNDELCRLASLLFVAGFETTTNLIGSGFLSLLAQPEQMEAIRNHPELAENVADELIRHDASFQLTTRYATADVTFDDVTIPAGDAIYVLLAAANRDPEQFPEPDRVDITRENARALSFGGGVHLCLGAPLAGLELEIVFQKLAQRFATIELGEVPPFHDRLSFRAPAAVPLKLRVAPSSTVSLAARPDGDDTQWREDYRRQMDEQGVDVTAEELAARVALLQRVPFFRPCSPDDLAMLARTAYPISFDPGEALTVSGHESPDCYIIAAGEADVVIDGRLVRTVTADDVVGERGLILGERRSADVTATTHMITYAVSRDLLQKVLDESPEVLAFMQAQVKRRYDS